MRALWYDPKFTCSQRYFYFYMCVISLWLMSYAIIAKIIGFFYSVWTRYARLQIVQPAASPLTVNSPSFIYRCTILWQIKNTPWQQRLYPCLSVYNKQKGIYKINLIKGQWWLSGGRNYIQVGCVWVGFCSPFQSQVRSCLNLNIQRNEKKSESFPPSVVSMFAFIYFRQQHYLSHYMLQMHFTYRQWSELYVTVRLCKRQEDFSFLGISTVVLHEVVWDTFKSSVSTPKTKII